MSSHFEMLVDTDVTIDDAEHVEDSVLKMLLARGIIAGDVNEHGVRAGAGFRPGPGLSTLYMLTGYELPFWRIGNCGIEPRVGRDFNYWALGPSCEGFACPVCDAPFEAAD